MDKNDVTLDDKDWSETIEFGELAFSVGFLRAHKELYDALVAGEIEGVPFTLVGDWRTLEPGDSYLAQRNSGLKLLTVKRVDVDKIGCVFPQEMAYPYDLHECFKIELHL